MSALTVDLVAADRQMWSGEARFVKARSISGDLGIMPGHTPLLAILAPGEVVIEGTDGSREEAQIESGFISVEHDRVTIVSDANAPA